jgi:F-type H+-transporting ATPase subunit b
MMQVDLFTWIAQIVNFLILVALLRHFLYGRIVEAIDKREEKIASRWREAEEQKDEASRRAEEYARNQKELEEHRETELARAREEAEAKKKEWMQAARGDVNRQRSEWQKSLEQDRQSFVQEFHQATADEITAVLRRMLGDLADAGLEKQMIRGFIRKLND